MAAQEYEIKAIKKGKAWKSSYGEFQSYALALKGIGEPVKLSVPLPVFDDPKPGDLLYGILAEEKVESRRYYNLELKPRSADYERTQDIHAQVAIKLAVEVWLGQGAKPEAYDNIQTEAIHFAKMINNVKKELA